MDDALSYASKMAMRDLAYMQDQLGLPTDTHGTTNGQTRCRYTEGIPIPAGFLSVG